MPKTCQAEKIWSALRKGTEEALSHWGGGRPQIKRYVRNALKLWPESPGVPRSESEKRISTPLWFILENSFGAELVVEEVHRCLTAQKPPPLDSLFQLLVHLNFWFEDMRDDWARCVPFFAEYRSIMWSCFLWEWPIPLPHLKSAASHLSRTSKKRIRTVSNALEGMRVLSPGRSKRFEALLGEMIGYVLGFRETMRHMLEIDNAKFSWPTLFRLNSPPVALADLHKDITRLMTYMNRWTETETVMHRELQVMVRRLERAKR